MTHSNLTRWIETAEARQVSETAMFEHNWKPSESHFLHLGNTIAKVSRLRSSIGLDSLAEIGCLALAYVRRPCGRGVH